MTWQYDNRTINASMCVLSFSYPLLMSHCNDDDDDDDDNDDDDDCKKIYDSGRQMYVL